MFLRWYQLLPNIPPVLLSTLIQAQLLDHSQSEFVSNYSYPVNHLVMPPVLTRLVTIVEEMKTWKQSECYKSKSRVHTRRREDSRLRKFRKLLAKIFYDRHSTISYANLQEFAQLSFTNFNSAKQCGIYQSFITVTSGPFSETNRIGVQVMQFFLSCYSIFILTTDLLMRIR
ncbi:hypothetical protein WN51_10852 [Melipona quadrifasciata]|uniref:Uncharacterized protein n=1 Tax=Melipona quadrifasciata TaxID=166423 RepID=A0A0M9A648_9HYME|nr:hypothetical protein WN51_10852 [Melipona quadrifasciata]